MNIDDILNKVNRDILISCIDPEWKNKLRRAQILSDKELVDLDKTKLIHIINTIYGNGLFENVSFRKLFLNQLDSTILYSLAKKYTSKAYQDKLINARNLANLPWSATSKLKKIFSEYLRIPRDYLPSELPKRKASELILPQNKLPDLMDYQSDVIKKIIDTVINNKSNFLVQMPTGSGKTRVMMEALTSLKNFEDGFNKNFLWLAHTEELIEQAIDALTNIWTEKAVEPITINRYYSNYSPQFEKLSDSFIFGSLQKISRSINRNKTDELISDIDIIIIDEAHKVLAPTYKKAIDKIKINCNPICIGISATPGRSVDNFKENSNFTKYFNNTLITPDLGENPIAELQNIKVLSNIQRRLINTNYFISDNHKKIDDDDYSKSLLNEISISEDRNKIIVNSIIEEYKLNNPVIVFSCTVDHSKLLSAALALEGIQSATLDLNTRKGVRRKIIEDFKAGKIPVLINFGVLTTGFDAPNIKTVLIARPTKSLILYSQMIGRGLRGPKMGGNCNCKLIDLVDNYKNHGSMQDIYSYFDNYWQ